MARTKQPEAETAETTEATPTESAATEAPAKTDEQKAADKAQREAESAQAEADLKGVIDTAISGADAAGVLTDADGEALQLAYRKIPAAARGRVQAEILREKMTQDGVNMAAVAAVLEVMTKAPASKPKSTRVAKPARPAFELVAESLTILALAQRTLLDGLETDDERTQARDASKAALSGTIEDEAERDALLNRVSRVVRSANPKSKASGGGGAGGERTTHTDTLKAIFDRGDLAAGAVLNHGTHTASIDAEGKIVVDGVEGSPFDNPTAAAAALLKAEGKSTQVNGWAWWNVAQGDKSISLGDLRKG